LERGKDPKAQPTEFLVRGLLGGGGNGGQQGYTDLSLCGKVTNDLSRDGKVNTDLSWGMKLENPTTNRRFIKLSDREVTLNNFYLIKPLTLIVPGEVKVDLANFDTKFWTKFSYIRFLNNYLFLQKRLPNLF
jgi:hypothetical protein